MQGVRDPGRLMRDDPQPAFVLVDGAELVRQDHLIVTQCADLVLVEFQPLRQHFLAVLTEQRSGGNRWCLAAEAHRQPLMT